MNDEHTGLPHDLPDYVPNWPVPVKIKAKVYKGGPLVPFWFWMHRCPTGGRVPILGDPELTQPAAFEAALKHARGCW